MPQSMTSAAPRSTTPRVRGRRSAVGGASTAVMGPMPDGDDFTFSIECRLDPRALTGALHDVTIHADWSVTTPHDLDAERVAMAFGAYTSCVPLADATVPALRGATPSLARQVSAAPRRFGARMWRLPSALQIAGCCEKKSFRTLAEATAHAYQVSHLSRSQKAPVWQLREVASLAAAQWEAWNRRRAGANGADELVREAGGVDDLWAAGITADDIVRLAEVVRAVNAPLPVSYFIGAQYGRADLTWVSTVVDGRPDPDFADWAAGLNGAVSRSAAEHWRDWLKLGLPRDDVRFAVEQAGPPKVVVQICDATGWSPTAAARTWLSWVRVGCRPTTAHLGVIASRSMQDVTPSAKAIDRLVAELHIGPTEPSLERRTELAVMLALLGTIAEVAFEASRGVTTVETLHRHGGRLLLPYLDQPAPVTRRRSRTRHQPDEN